MIEQTQIGSVAVLEMSHGKANALDLELVGALREALAGVVAGPADAVVLTGNGRMFSAGVDLVRLLADGSDYVERFMPLLSGAFVDLFSCPLPVVAAIDGHAIAGGCVLACAGDHRLMVPAGGAIGLTELAVGVPFPPSAMEIVRTALPLPGLPELLFSGRLLEAEEARRIGLVDELVESEHLIERACSVAERLGGIPKPAFSITKRQLRQAAIDRIQAQAETVGREVEAFWASPTGLAAVRSFVRTTLGKSS